MPRLPRISVPGVLYYITDRAPKGQELFRDEDDYHAYLRLLRKAKEDGLVKIYAYVLMPDHVHTLIELNEGANVSDIMQALNTAYTKHYNHRYDRKGRVFNGRFKTTYVEKDRHLLEVTRHIHLNPSKAGLAQDPALYKYCSAGAYAGNKGSGLRNIAPCVSEEAREVIHRLDSGGSHEAYVAYLCSWEKKDAQRLHKRLHRGGFLGSDAFVMDIKSRMGLVAKPDAAVKTWADPSVTTPDPEMTAEHVRRAAPVWNWLLPVAASAAVVLLAVTAGFYFSRITDLAQPEPGVAESTGTVEAEPLDRYGVALIQKELDLRSKEEELKRKEAMLNDRSVKVARMETQRTLDGTVWAVVVRDQRGETVREDVLRFRDGTISSDWLISQGFASSQYSVRKIGDTIVLETTQVGSNGEQLSLRADWRGDDLRGEMLVRIPGQDGNGYRFTSRGVEFSL